MIEIDVVLEDGFCVFKNKGVDVWDFRCSEVDKAMPLLKDKRWFTPIVEWKLKQIMKVAA